MESLISFRICREWTTAAVTWPSQQGKRRTASHRFVCLFVWRVMMIRLIKSASIRFESLSPQSIDVITSYRWKSEQLFIAALVFAKRFAWTNRKSMAVDCFFASFDTQKLASASFFFLPTFCMTCPTRLNEFVVSHSHLYLLLLILKTFLLLYTLARSEINLWLKPLKDQTKKASDSSGAHKFR